MHNVHEFLGRDLSVLVPIKLVHHRLQLLLRQVLPELPGHALHVLQANLARPIVVEQLGRTSNRDASLDTMARKQPKTWAAE